MILGSAALNAGGGVPSETLSAIFDHPSFEVVMVPMAARLNAQIQRADELARQQPQGRGRSV